MSTSSTAAAVVAEGSAARRFWIAAASREAAFAAYTPFLVSLAAGALRLDSFRQYIAQDAYFLHAFARAYLLLPLSYSTKHRDSDFHGSD